MLLLLLLLLLPLIGKVNSERLSSLSDLIRPTTSFLSLCPLPFQHQSATFFVFVIFALPLPFLSSFFQILCQILTFCENRIRNSKVTCIKIFCVKDFHTCEWFLHLRFIKLQIPYLHFDWLYEIRKDRIVTYISNSLRLTFIILQSSIRDLYVANSFFSSFKKNNLLITKT